MMKRRGALSLQMIILAAAGILVLSIVAYLVLDTGESTSGAVGCTAQGGVCTDEPDGCEEIESDGDEPLCSGGETCCQPLT